MFRLLRGKKYQRFVDPSNLRNPQPKIKIKQIHELSLLLKSHLCKLLVDLTVHNFRFQILWIVLRFYVSFVGNEF